MLPRKDYEDYSKFINDTFHSEKVNLLTQTVNNEQRRESTSPPAMHLRTLSDYKGFNTFNLRSGFKTAKNNRSISIN